MILKKSKTKWIDLAEKRNADGELLGVYSKLGLKRIKLGNPTVEQKEEMREMMFVVLANNPKLFSALKEEKPDFTKGLTAEQIGKQQKYLVKMAQQRIKCCIKDWEGVEDEKGNKIECVIVNDELHPDLFNSFIDELQYDDIIDLGDLINSETEFTESDKKKL